MGEGKGGGRGRGGAPPGEQREGRGEEGDLAGQLGAPSRANGSW